MGLLLQILGVQTPFVDRLVPSAVAEVQIWLHAEHRAEHGFTEAVVGDGLDTDGLLEFIVDENWFIEHLCQFALIHLAKQVNERRIVEDDFILRLVAQVLRRVHKAGEAWVVQFKAVFFVADLVVLQVEHQSVYVNA